MFDLLYFNGEPLVKKPLQERRKLLRENFKEVDEEFRFASSVDVTTLEEVQEYLEESVKGLSANIRNRIQEFLFASTPQIDVNKIFL